jgi:hypothetical protein
MSIYLDKIDKPIKEFIMPVMKEKTTFYCVMVEFYINETVKTAITTRMCKEKPQNRADINPIMHFSNTWFETEAEAAGYLAEVKGVSKDGRAA